MAITAKVVFVFGMTKWGWTETYYFNSASGSILDAKAGAIGLGLKRAKLLAKEAELEAIRVSDVTNPRQTLLVMGASAGFTSSSGTGETPWNSALIRVTGMGSSNINYTRFVQLRGLPYLWYTPNPVVPLNPTLNGSFVTALNNFLAVLLGTTGQGNPGLTPWMVRASNLDRTLNPSYKVLSAGIVADSYGRFKIMLDPATAPTWKIGDKIHVSGARGIGTKGLNADAYITKVDPVTAEFELSSQQKCGPIIPPVLIGKPIAYLRNYIYAPVVDAFFERFLKRDTGRAFFGTRGARSTSRC